MFWTLHFKKTQWGKCASTKQKKPFWKQNQYSAMHSTLVHPVQPILFTHTVAKTFIVSYQPTCQKHANNVPVQSSINI
jgi:hypothetical protein